MPQSFLRKVVMVVAVVAVLVPVVRILPVSAVGGVPTFVQQNSKKITNGTSNSVAFTTNNTAGNLIVVYLIYPATVNITVADSKGNAYQSAVGPTLWNNGTRKVQVFYAKNIFGGANTVTANYSPSLNGNGSGIIYINEYSGVATSSPVDVTAAAIGTTSSMNSGSVTTTNANDLLFGAGVSSNTVTAPGTGYTTRSTFSGNIVMDKDVTVAGSYSATATQNSNAWALQMVAFKASGASDTTPPSTPTGLSATAISSSQINLSWTASTDPDNTASQLSYKVFRNGIQVGTTTAGTASYSDTGLIASTTYSYAVSASDPARNVSAQSASVNATTFAPPDTTPPTVPTNLSATAVSPNQINLSWTVSTDNVGVAGYKVYRGGVQVGTTTAISYSDTGLSPATQYPYTVSAYDAAGNNSAQSASASATTQAAIDTTAPSIPTNLSATAISSSQINLSWTASTDSDNTASQLTYNIFRGGNQIGTTAAGVTTFNDVGLSASTTYFYTVSASDPAGNISGQSTSANATTQAVGDTVPPSVPSNLGATTMSASEIDLTWTASTDNVGVAGYTIYRDNSPISTTSATSYNDINLTPSSTYSYAVSAYDAAGNNSATSTTVFATTQPAPSTKFIIGDRVQVSSGPLNVRATPSANGTILGTQPTGALGNVTSGPVYADSYNWWNINYDAGASGWSVEDFLQLASTSDTTAPSVPTGLSATAISSSQVNLSWTASTDNVGVAGYQVFRGGNLVATTSAVSYSDTGLTASTTYTYTVAAYDAAGNVSAQSASANATTQANAANPYPVKMSTSGRYLVDQNNNPFYLVGDTAHSLMGALNLTDAATYFANRQQNHFNSVAIYAPCASYIRNCNANGSTVDGIVPFTSGTSPSTFDLSTPNPAYFSRLDAIVNSAANYGLIVLLDPIETGDFLVTLQNNGATKAYNYGVYIGTRYKSFPNIIWQHGEDFQSWATASDSNLVAQVMAGIASVDPNHLQTAELSYNTSYSNQDTNLTPYLTYDLAYTYAETYDMVLQAWNSTPISPAFLGEANYENANNTQALPGPATPFNLREQEYWTLTAGGIGGQYYGEYTVHHFLSGWQNFLNTPGVTQLSYLENLIAPLQWWQLVPDQTHAVVTSGYGTYNGNNLNLSAANYATTAWVSDGSLSLTYTPVATTLTVNMAKMGGAVTARWFDPSAGTYQTIAGSPFANTGSHSFATPGTNNGGSPDWVLVLQASGGGGGGGGDTTAPSTPTGLSATAASSNQINLSWTASTDPDNTAAQISYKIYRGGTQVGTTAAGVNSYSDTGLTASTNYSYTVAASDPTGNTSAQSASANATTQAATDTTIPSVPTNLSATAISSSQINLSWTASTDPDNTASQLTYQVFRNGTQVGTTAAGVTTYSDGSLTASTTYTYVVSAQDPAGNTSAQSASAQATTQPAPTLPIISLVQTTNIDAGTGLTGSKAFNSNTTAGNFIVVVWRQGAAQPTLQVGDSQHNTYNLAVRSDQTGGASFVGADVIYYAMNIAGGADTINVTSSLSSTERFAIAEYSGVATSSALDQATSAINAGSTAVASGAVTPSQNGELVIGALANASGETWTPSTIFTSRAQIPTGTSKLLFEDLVQTTAVAVNATATISASNPWTADIVTFKP